MLHSGQACQSACVHCRLSSTSGLSVTLIVRGGLTPLQQQFLSLPPPFPSNRVSRIPDWTPTSHAAKDKDDFEFMILPLIPTSGFRGVGQHARFMQCQDGVHGLVPGRQALYSPSFSFSRFLSYVNLQRSMRMSSPPWPPFICCFTVMCDFKKAEMVLTQHCTCSQGTSNLDLHGQEDHRMGP